MEDFSQTEIGLQVVKGRAIRGIVALTGRTFLLQIISFFGFFLLTVLLDKAEIGLFFAVSELVAILGYFSDIGLAAALIQKKEKPKLNDIRSTFTIQQSLVFFLVVLVLVLTPWLRDFYQISPSGVWLFRALLAGFFLASLKTIPSVLLERQLKFNVLVVVEIAETVLFYGLAVLLAWQGLGVISYAWAVLFRGIVGAVLIYLFSPWKVGFAFERESLRHLLKFGLPYQANTFLAVIKDRLMNVFLWKIVGVTGVGILGWAQKWAQMPLRFIMDSVMKVTFPAYARMQDQRNDLQRAIEKTLFFISFLVFPLIVGMAVLAKPLMTMIPRYSKWEVALLAFYFYSFNSLWAAVTTPLTNVLTATGKIKVVFRLMIMWTLLTWIFYPFLALRFGYNGAAAAAALVALSSVVAIAAAKKQIKFQFLAPISKPLIASFLMGLIVFWLVDLLAKSVLGIAGLILIGGLIYLALIYLMLGEQLIVDVRRFLDATKKKS